jgi:translation elongation factor EF-4
MESLCLCGWGCAGGGENFSVQEVGILCPYQLRTKRLYTGQVGPPPS